MAIVKKEVRNRYYTIVSDLGENVKCPPQALLIINTIKAAGGRIGREELITLLKRPPEDGGLKTGQTVERILGFYRPRLIDMGVMKEEFEVSVIEVELPDKPKKEKKVKEKKEKKVDSPEVTTLAEGEVPLIEQPVKQTKGKKEKAA